MKIIIGTYRADKALIRRCVMSIQDYVEGYDSLIFVDDSGDVDFQRWMQNSYGEVFAVDKENAGYAKAMAKVTEIMQRGEDDYYCFWEEDFVAVEDVNLEDLGKELDNDPTLAQVVLVRQPWFDNEKERGDIISALADRIDGPILQEKGVTETLWVHQLTFSCNPAVWSPMAYRHGWPQCNDSEDFKTRYLVDDDEASFAFYGHRVRVFHDGERVGSGY